MNKRKKRILFAEKDRFARTPVSELESDDGKMSTAEFCVAIRKLGLDSPQAGKWLGYTERHGFRFASGDVKIPPAISKLLTLTLRLGLRPEQV